MGLFDKAQPLCDNTPRQRTTRISGTQVHRFGHYFFAPNQSLEASRYCAVGIGQCRVKAWYI
jgi:hypothetical protein